MRQAAQIRYACVAPRHNVFAGAAATTTTPVEIHDRRADGDGFRS
jgi:hypothetical protein